MKIIRVFLFTLLLIIISTPQSSAYLDGIEDGDQVNLHYILTYDNKVQEDNPEFVTFVKKGQIIDGFYEGLLRMKLGQTENIVVPIGKGYPPSHKLGDKILYFEVTINSILQNVRGNNYTPPPVVLEPFQFGASDDSGSALEDLTSNPLFGLILLTAIISFVYIKSTGSTKDITETKKLTKLTPKERVQKRMKEVDNSNF